MTTTDRRDATRSIEPPYLVTTATDKRGVSVEVIADASSTVVEFRVHGQWSRQLGDQVTAGLRLCLAGPSEALIMICAIWTTCTGSACRTGWRHSGWHGPDRRPCTWRSAHHR